MSRKSEKGGVSRLPSEMEMKKRATEATKLNLEPDDAVEYINRLINK